ncbi:MAG TPA: hypothetical protein VK563_07345 [Puia sp.]|nr:hypothetical protein [Puia sp.]
MKYERYHIESSSSFLKFEFISKGPKGNIKKQVIFRQTDDPDVYNLGFGDVDPDTGDINDIAVTNNNDSQKVLATVAWTVVSFFERNPGKFVFATGSTTSRTRLYRIGISTNLKEIQKDFEIFGYQGFKWEIFEPGKDYEAFLIRNIS